MFYTLLKFLGWGILLAFIGGCIGWALRSLKSRGQSAAQSSTDGADDIESMRRRLADLDQIVAERDRLRIQLADVRHADSPGIVGAGVPPLVEQSEPEPEPEPEPDAALADLPGDASDDASGDVPGEDVAGEESSVDDDADEDDADEDVADEDVAGADDAAPADLDVDLDPDLDVDVDLDLDLDAAADTLGKKVRLDDLSVVEGIGPKISELCRGIGITTWRQLADTEVAELQSMLTDAGSRYSVHKPGSWPQQASLLAAGRWAEFQAFTEDLRTGK